eukprot:c28361_g1_i1 orf=545-2047(+)
MGVGQSKGELLYQEVQNRNHDAVTALRREGASLEWVDKEGRTPLILACTRGELLDMAITLLNLGANITAYRPGTHGGFPLHHAAKRGLDKTVSLLLSRGANPLAINDDGQLPLDMARNRGHVSVVRLLEDQLSLFCGMMRELSGPGILETFAPSLCTKMIWAVVLITESRPMRSPRHELAIYISPKVGQPRTIIQLSKSELEEPNLSLTDPILYIFDKTTKTKYKFLSENEGDKVQLERFYKACKGITEVHPVMPQQSESQLPARRSDLQPVTSSTASNPRKSFPSEAASIPEDAALALALEASIKSATEEGILISPNTDQSMRINEYNGWASLPDGSYNNWYPSDSKKSPKKTRYGGWEGGVQSHTYNGWGSATAGPSSSSVGYNMEDSLCTELHTTGMHVVPSAPPLPGISAIDSGSIQYPSIDTPATEVDNLSDDVDKKMNASGMCIVCWDAPREIACIPCGHLVGCMSCLTEIHGKEWGCPVCREPIQQIVKVYAV